MSGIAKACIVISILAALAGGYFGYEIIQQRDEFHRQFDETTDTLNKTKKTLEETKSELETAKGQIKDLDGKLSDANSKNSNLTSKVSELNSKISELDKSIADTKQQLSSVTDKLAKLESDLGGKTPADLKDAIAKAQKEVDRVTAEKKKVEDDLSGQKAEVARLNDLRERSKTGEMPPGINGKVLKVNQAWNFVVLNVGNLDGVVENGVLVVYRDKQFVGKVKVVSTEPHTCVADIIPEMTKAAVQEGDEVFN